MTITHDIALLCAALDAGDDTALGPLADALEEAGDSRAAGLRRVLHVGYGPRYVRNAVGWVWEEYAVGANLLDEDHVLAPDHFRRLIHYRRKGRTPRGADSRIYNARSAALLALAEALKES